MGDQVAISVTSSSMSQPKSYLRPPPGLEILAQHSRQQHIPSPLTLTKPECFKYRLAPPGLPISPEHSRMGFLRTLPELVEPQRITSRIAPPGLPISPEHLRIGFVRSSVELSEPSVIPNRSMSPAAIRAQLLDHDRLWAYSMSPVLQHRPLSQRKNLTLDARIHEIEELQQGLWRTSNEYLKLECDKQKALLAALDEAYDMFLLVEHDETTKKEYSSRTRTLYEEWMDIWADCQWKLNNYAEKDKKKFVRRLENRLARERGGITHAFTLHERLEQYIQDEGQDSKFL